MAEVAARDGNGAPVDSQGRAAQDPTRNVLDLVDAAITRQDDLRAMEAAHIRDLLTIRAEHFKDLRLAETARIDAIRAVDVGNVAAAATVSATQATTLAAQVATSADTLRTQVAAAAQAATVALAAALDPIQKDIADLRRAQYEQQGQKAQVIEGRDAAADMKPIVEALERLTAAQNQNQGQKAQVVDTRSEQNTRANMLGMGIGVAAVIVSIAGIIIAVIVKG